MPETQFSVLNSHLCPDHSNWLPNYETILNSLPPQSSVRTESRVQSSWNQNSNKSSLKLLESNLLLAIDFSSYLSSLSSWWRRLWHRGAPDGRRQCPRQPARADRAAVRGGAAATTATHCRLRGLRLGQDLCRVRILILSRRFIDHTFCRETICYILNSIYISLLNINTFHWVVQNWFMREQSSATKLHFTGL